MSKTLHPESASASPRQLNLINSKRLQALRNKNSGSEIEQPDQDAPLYAAASNSKEDASDAKLRLQIDQRLAQIMTQLPAGKQNSLFKIRYGVSLDEIRKLPLARITRLLKITPAKPG